MKSVNIRFSYSKAKHNRVSNGHVPFHKVASATYLQCREWELEYGTVYELCVRIARVMWDYWPGEYNYSWGVLKIVKYVIPLRNKRFDFLSMDQKELEEFVFCNMEHFSFRVRRNGKPWH